MWQVFSLQGPPPGRMPLAAAPTGFNPQAAPFRPSGGAPRQPPGPRRPPHQGRPNHGPHQAPYQAPQQPPYQSPRHGVLNSAQPMVSHGCMSCLMVCVVILEEHCKTELQEEVLKRMASEKDRLSCLLSPADQSLHQARSGAGTAHARGARYRDRL